MSIPRGMLPAFALFLGCEQEQQRERYCYAYDLAPFFAVFFSVPVFSLISLLLQFYNLTRYRYIHQFRIGKTPLLLFLMTDEALLVIVDATLLRIFYRSLDLTDISFFISLTK
jgi:hypothetical protein